MSSEKISLVFFGTGPVSAATLEAIAPHFSIEAIITKPPKTHHGKPVTAPVIDWARQHEIMTYQPPNSGALAELFNQRTFISPVGLVVDYGIIIPELVIKHFPKGILNSHFSLLPEWRGPDPITAAILSGQSVSGVSLMVIVSKLDEGQLIAQEQMRLPDGITIDQLTTNLVTLSNQLLIEKLPEYVRGQLEPYSQDSAHTPTYSKRVAKSDGQLDWQKPAKQLEREIRAYVGWPGSRFKLADKDIIVTKAHAVPSAPAGAKPGELTVVPRGNALAVATSSGSLLIERLKPAGKREMSVAEFLAGNKLAS